VYPSRRDFLRSTAVTAGGLLTGRIDAKLSGEIKDAVHSLESLQVRDLMNLLGSVQVRPPSGR
jgi:hypothetical protein